MTISEKVAYLKGLAEGLNLDVEKSKEGRRPGCLCPESEGSRAS